MTDPLADVLKGLRRDYLRESAARVAELRAHLDAVERGQEGALDALRRALHKLAGSGGSYGFDVVSKSSRDGEQVARRLVEAAAAPTLEDLTALRDAVTRVDAAFARARADEASPG